VIRCLGLHGWSSTLVNVWLKQYDRRERNVEEAEASVMVRAKIASLERKGGQLTMGLEPFEESRACAS
jgi:hypothetical protein